jgi:fatty acid metabolism transcriptional regulator FadR
MIEPLVKKRLPDQVHEELRKMIFQGAFPPGQKLPPERELASRFGVNRGAVREALRQLEENGLISVRHGGGAEILDWKKKVRFEFLGELIFMDGEVNLEVLRSMLELREILGPELAGFAARRAGEKDIKELEDIAASLLEAKEEAGEFQKLEYRFNQVLARASGNITFRFMVDSIGDIYLKNARFFKAGMALLRKEASRYPQLARAVKNGNEEEAGKIMKELFDVSGREFLKLLETGKTSGKETSHARGGKTKGD